VRPTSANSQTPEKHDTETKSRLDLGLAIVAGKNNKVQSTKAFKLDKLLG
jgi:hypothetical protein